MLIHLFAVLINHRNKHYPAEARIKSLFYHNVLEEHTVGALFDFMLCSPLKTL